MKKKLSFIAFLTTVAINALLFSGCDWLFENDDNNDNPPGDNFEYVVGTTLIQTKWAQRAPYNNMMVGTIRHRTGCGTTAMAQIMKYWEYPRQGIGQSEPYSTGIGTTVPSINFANIAFDWNNMLNTYPNANSGTETQRNAVANLMYHAAVGFRINSGSAGTDGGTSITRMINAMTAYFGYDKSMQRRSSQYFDDNTWKQMIREQLDAGMPVFANSPGHFYIIDGYDDNDMFHFNWGWNGRSDGWYPINIDYRTLGSEDTDSGEDDDSQNIIINIKPDEGGESPGYEIALREFRVQKTTVTQNEQFEAYARMVNVSSEYRFMGGTARVVLVDNNGNTTVIGTSSMGEGSSWTRLEDRPIYCFVPTASPGQYQLRIETRPTDGEWRLATLSLFREGVPNAINITVNAETGTPGGGYGQRLLVFETDKQTANQSETTQFTVTLQMRNTTSETFSGGHYTAALLDDAGNIVSILGTGGSGSLSAGNRHTSTRNINCEILPNTIALGQYLLRILVRPNAASEWRIATMSDTGVPISFAFEVR